MKDIRPKKSLGQNFLGNRGVLKKIIIAAELEGGDTVLEIGPGTGILTEELLAASNKVIAVEKDRRLIPHLKDRFSKEISSGKLILLEDDILEFKPENHGLITGGYKMAANIPYYLTGAIMRKFLSAKIQPEKMVLMIQKEVAKRITAKNGNGSLVSLSVKAYGEPRYVATVSRGSFRPAPKVDSAIISIEKISRKNFKTEVEENHFFDTLHAGFAHKRKKLISNLKDIFPNVDWQSAFKAEKVKETARAEELKMEQWLSLAKNLTFF